MSNPVLISEFKKVVSFVKPQTMVTFIVGADEIKQTFLVHRNVACAHSTFFKAAFESQMMEGLNQSMRLEDVEAGIFGMLVDWLYNKAVEYADVLHSLDFSIRPPPNFDPQPLTSLWKLAQRAMIPDLQKAVEVRLYGLLSWASKESLVEFCDVAFQNDESTLKKIAVNLACEMASDTFSGIVRCLPAEMTCIVAEELKRREAYPPRHLRLMSLREFLTSGGRG